MSDPDGITVLLVEDSDSIALIERKALEAAGCRVSVVARGQEALARIEQDPPQCVVLDHNLPDMTGDELVAALAERIETLPVVMVTGHGDQELAVSMLKAGVADYAVKDADLGFVQELPKIVRDVVERFELASRNRELELRLREAQKLRAVGSLAAGIAHEINTPIQFVGDNSRFLAGAFESLIAVLQAFEACHHAYRDGAGVDEAVAKLDEAKHAADIEFLAEEVPKAIADMMGGVERVAKIVRAMKEFSHVDTEQRMAGADLNRALESTLTVANNELKSVAEVRTEFDPTLPMVECRLGELNQVFLNLLINAAHAIADARGDEPTAPLGTITVTTRRDGDAVVVAIGDTGPGIPPDVRERIFEPFFTTKEVGRGSGQGLALAYSVVHSKHGGSLTFETEAGRGTTFFVRLPIEQQPA